jgi:hypothetical protein
MRTISEVGDCLNDVDLNVKGTFEKIKEMPTAHSMAIIFMVFCRANLNRILLRRPAEGEKPYHRDVILYSHSKPGDNP